MADLFEKLDRIGRHCRDHDADDCYHEVEAQLREIREELAELLARVPDTTPAIIELTAS